MFRLNLTIFAFTLLIAAEGVMADIVPTWTTENNQEIELPISGSTSFEATGNVAGFFEVILAFDTSGSMAFDTGQTATNGGMRRHDWAVAGATGLIGSLDDRIRMGLVEFDGVAALTTPTMSVGPVDKLDSHRNLLIEDVNGLIPDGTNIANAIEFSTNQFAFDNGSISQHLVLVSDGMQKSGDAIAAVESAFDIGVDSFNTVGLPGANIAFLEELANIGEGTFVDGTNLDDLVENFSEILNSIESLERLDIILPDGSILNDIETSLDGDFTISGDIFAGNNTFIARATSNLGNVTFAELNVIGISQIPEPTATLILTALLMTGSIVRRKI